MIHSDTKLLLEPFTHLDNASTREELLHSVQVDISMKVSVLVVIDHKKSSVMTLHLDLVIGSKKDSLS